MASITELSRSLPKRFSVLDEYKQHLNVSENKRQKRRRSWADQDVAHESMPHGKTYAILAAEGIVARAKQILTEDESRKSSTSSREE
ncbi:hypothetical protein EKO04_007169 [Ascochyta lentis]|uniref:Uncharacterized protein n=1 Tax=Ascochyta lentis TaxID=205686 RepID=A0A8H7J235_9PLEO|nr:hypothetical protein EKO04_007169 [Ascochyta lentis]